MTRWPVVAYLALVVGLSLAVGHLATYAVDPLLIWGGTDCSTSTVGGTAIRSCAGYPPSGLMLIVLLVGMATMPVLARLTDDGPTSA